MKKFIIETIVGTAFICLAGFLLYRINIPAPIAKRLLNVDKKIEIVNLGNSHGGSFEYETCKYKGIRMSKAANTLYYDLQNYLFLYKENYLAENAIVIIPIAYFVLGLDENRTDQSPDDSFVNDFYYYLPKDQIYDYSREKNASLTILNIQKNFQKIFAKWTKLLDRKPIAKSKKEEEKEKKQTAKPKSTEDEKQRVVKILDRHGLSRAKTDKGLSSYSSRQKNLDYLESIIQEVINNENIPILVSTPYYHSYNENFGREWLEENYFKIVKAISSKYDIPYLDYSHDKRFCFEPDYFYNSDHLNRKGRDLFSSIAFSDIEKVLK